MDDQQGIVVKLNSDLSVAWSQDYGLNTGADQIFDLVVDSDGNYLLGGHTTAGTTNWDYLAIKVDGATKQQLWRIRRRVSLQCRIWRLGQRHLGLLPRGGRQERGQAVRGHLWLQGWASDIWVSYLVVVGKNR